MLKGPSVLGLGLTFLAAGAVGWTATTWATPRVIMSAALERIEAEAGGPNRMIKAPPVDQESREVVRPSPDLLYSLCAYDVSESDILVKVGSTPGYWSISFYDEATNNFDVRGYRGGSEDLRIFTISKGAMARQVVRSPSNRGLALIRRRVGNREELEAAIDAQHDDDCGPLPNRAHATGSSARQAFPH